MNLFSLLITHQTMLPMYLWMVQPKYPIHLKPRSWWCSSYTLHQQDTRHAQVYRPKDQSWLLRIDDRAPNVIILANCKVLSPPTPCIYAFLPHPFPASSGVCTMALAPYSPLNAKLQWWCHQRQIQKFRMKLEMLNANSKKYCLHPQMYLPQTVACRANLHVLLSCCLIIGSKMILW